MKILANYATFKFSALRTLNSATGIEAGGFDEVREFSPRDLDETFRKKNAHILKQTRGAGYYIWKPYIILECLQSMRADDVLFYSDAARFFTGPVAPLVDLMRRTGQDVIAFRGRGMERAWTKRDTFVLMDCDTPEYADTFQVHASLSLWRRTPFSIMIAGEWLRYAEDERLLTDIPNSCGQDNFAEFQEHRRDQSIWSLLCKKHSVVLHRRPFTPPDGEFPHSTYPAFLGGRRKTDRPWAVLDFWLTHPMRRRIARPALGAFAFQSAVYSRRAVRRWLQAVRP